MAGAFPVAGCLPVLGAALEFKGSRLFRTEVSCLLSLGRRLRLPGETQTSLLCRKLCSELFPDSPQLDVK